MDSGDSRGRSQNRDGGVSEQETAGPDPLYEPSNNASLFIR